MPLTQLQLADIKKRLCNPPYENIAASGDPEILGCFQGVGELLDTGAADPCDPELLAKFLSEVAAIEATYAADRKRTAKKCLAAMSNLTSGFLESL